MQNECAICGRTVSEAYVCKHCRREYDLTEVWAKVLIDEEKRWRNLKRKDTRHGVVVFSDYCFCRDQETLDGWDVLDGESDAMGSDDFRNALGSADTYFEEDWGNWDVALTDIIFSHVAEAADLTQGELNTLIVYLFPPHSLDVSSEEAAILLTQIEGKPISNDAFRRRKSDAMKKLKRLGERLKQLTPEMPRDPYSDGFTHQHLLWLEELLRRLDSS